MQLNQSIEKHALLWSWSAATLALLPLAEYLPPTIVGLTFAIIASRVGLYFWRDTWLPKSWFVGIFGIVCVFFVLFTYIGKISLLTGIALIFVLTALKCFELRRKRDQWYLIYLLHVVLFSYFFIDQSFIRMLWAVLVFWLVFILMMNQVQQTAFFQLKHHHYLGRMMLAALPLGVVFFLFFPRIEGGLWSFKINTTSAQTGLSDQMTPGSIANLLQSDRLAFRVEFNGNIPEKRNLYWRGPVLENFDGRNWRIGPLDVNDRARVYALDQHIDYRIYLEPHNQDWVFALDAPYMVASNLRLAPTMQMHDSEIVTKRRTYDLSSSLRYQYFTNMSQDKWRQLITVPPEVNPRTRNRAAEWLANSQNSTAYIQQVHEFFLKNPFEYTLSPNLWGVNGIDQFLFEDLHGFCEHYAAAYVFLMRLGNIPARVVLGYQGGEQNEIDGLLTVRQSDAHAWAEIWDEKQGWRRVDPTSFISPTRINNGINSAITNQDSLPILLRSNFAWLNQLRHGLESLQTAWYRHVVGFNARYQNKLFANWGIPNKTVATVIAVSLALLIILVIYLVLGRKKQRIGQDRVHYEWILLRQTLAEFIVVQPGDVPTLLLRRMAGRLPDAVYQQLQTAINAYLANHYGQHAAGHTAKLLKRARLAIRKQLWRQRYVDSLLQWRSVKLSKP